MESLIQQEENKARNLIDDPQYFGGYLNMARHNIFSINNHLASYFGTSGLSNEEQIPDSFLLSADKRRNQETKELIKENLLFERTLRFMPIFRIFDTERLPKEVRLNTENMEKDFDEMRKCLKQVFSELNIFRNDYTHYFSTNTETTRKLQVTPELEEFLSRSFKLAIAFTKQRMRDVLKEEDYSLVEKKVMVLPEERVITTEGIVFLACMFLEREYAFQFIGKVVGLKGTHRNEFIATREVLMAYCVKLPHDKFISEDSKQALILDIANELNKCPLTLYDVITEDGRKQFRPELTDDAKKSVIENCINEDLEVDYDEYIQILTKKVRYKNRFPYFAFQYIEETKLLDNFRFSIDLGQFVLAEYEKRMAGEPTSRIVVENVKAFKYLKEVTDEDVVLGLMKSNPPSNRFLQFSPHYNSDNNKIGISSKPQTSVVKSKGKIDSKIEYKIKQPLPRAFVSIHELPKIILLDYLSKGSVVKIINSFIRTNKSIILDVDKIKEIKEKLPNNEVWFPFRRMTDSKKHSAYSEKQKAEILRRKKLLNEILSSYSLNIKQIPSRIIDYWLNIIDVRKERSFSDRIKLMKRDCADRYKAVKRNEKDKTVAIPKIGEMATFLAKDIVAMIVDEDKKSKITSFYYDKMQECLALYANIEKKNLFIHLVTNELKLNEKGGHPFLKRINLNSITRTKELYEIYLSEKAYKLNSKENDESWMSMTFYHLEWNEKAKKKMTKVVYPVNDEQIPYTIKQWNKPQQPLFDRFTNEQGKSSDWVRLKPLDLPTNLFDEEICVQLRSRLQEAKIPFDNISNYSELLKLWWKSRDDSTQPFYLLERQYNIYDESVRFTLNSKNKFKDYYQAALKKVFNQKKAEREAKRRFNKRLPDIQFKDVERVFKHAIAETEKQIRIIQEEDRIMLLMLEKLMDDQQLKLGKAETLLSSTVPVKQKIGDKTNSSRVIVAQRKQKHYTVLRKYQYDRRLPELFKYTTEKEELKLEWLEDELKAYNKGKLKVFDLVFSLEKRIIEVAKQDIIALLDKSGSNDSKFNVDHKPYIKWLENMELINSKEAGFMKKIRNSFSHNQFPECQTVELMISLKSDIPIATQIVNEYERLILRISSQIEKMK